MTQESLGLNTPQIDVSKFVKFEASTGTQRFQVGGVDGRRSGEVGLCLGVISLRHAGGYEVLLEFPDGKVESFAPMALFPMQEAKRAPAASKRSSARDDGPSGP